MLDFGIPNDSIKIRKRLFKQLLKPDPDTGYIDGATDYSLLCPFADDNQFDTETRLWMAFLYGLSYSCTTVMRFTTKFPTLSQVTPKAVKQFWAEERDTLWFQPDKKYLKNNNQVVPAIRSIYKLSHGNMSQYLLPLLKQGFDTTYKEITKTWQFFGPHGAYLFFDAIYGLLPELYTNPEHLDWKHCGQTVPEGMAHVLGLDEQALHQEPYDIEKYNRVVDRLCQLTEQPKVIIESTLCFFRKLFKGTRYLGYYADRQLEECIAVSNILAKDCGIDIWSYRKRSCSDYLRGEDNNWDGIRKERCHLFLKTGTLMGEGQ